MNEDSNSLTWVLDPKKDGRHVNQLQRTTADTHPLNLIPSAESKHLTSLQASKLQRKSKSALFDPLSDILDGGDPLNDSSLHSDPLSQSANGQESLKKMNPANLKTSDISPVVDNSITWEKLHSIFLSRFATKQRLSFATSCLPTSEAGTINTQNVSTDRSKSMAQTGGERVKTRLEHLDTLTDSGSSGSANDILELKGLTQEQFTQNLTSLKLEMVQSWHSEQRVKALKIAIQCVKILSLSSPEMFYPCKFMLVTDILDELGTLVYQRIKNIKESTSSDLEVEETRKMWLYKIASLREFLPRLYLEAALAHCLVSTPTSILFDRLIKMTRGIGDPLVNVYAKMYIVRIGERENVLDQSYIYNAIEDSFLSIKWGWNGGGIVEFEVPKEETEKPRTIAEKVLLPPFQWLFQCLAKKASPDVFIGILKLTEATEGIGKYVILRAILMKFPPSFLSPHCNPILELISSCYHLGQNPREILIDLAHIVNQIQPPQEERLPLFNCAWQLVSKFKNINDYLSVAAPWIRFVAVNFSCYELDKVLNEVLKRLSVPSMGEAAYGPSSLLSLVTSALSYVQQPDVLYSTGSFQALLSIFQREILGSGSGGSSAGSISKLKELLETIILKHPGDFVDPTIIQLLLSLFSSLHDGINALTTQDERRQISQIIILFIHKVTFGRDFEHQLQFYVDARASFSSLDSVLEALIQQVCRLQIATLNIVKGKHSGKTSGFEHACTAYCFITIPSLSQPITRLKLYLLCGSVAMVNGCMGQGDACIKSAIKELLELIPQQAPSTPINQRSRSLSLSLLSEEITSALVTLSSYLVAIPDPPDASKPLYLFRGVANALKSFKGIEPHQYCSLSLSVIKGISSCARNYLPYHFKGVDGIDTLYGAEDSVQEAAQLLCSELLVDIISYLKRSIINVSDVHAGLIAVELMEMLITYCDINNERCQSLSTLLLKVISKNATTVKFKDDVLKRYEKIQISS